MSKTEIVKSLNDSGPQLEIIRNLRDLSQDMKALPSAVASEVAPMLAELERLAQLLDQNMAAQRATFGAIAEASAESWKQQLQEAQALNQALRDRLTAMEAKEELTVKAARAMLAVPAKIEKTVEDHARTMALAVEEWKDHERSKKPWRLVLASAVLAAVLATALHPAGTLVSEKLRSSDQMETDALAMRQLWEKATPNERDLMTGILKRQR